MQGAVSPNVALPSIVSILSIGGRRSRPPVIPCYDTESREGGAERHLYSVLTVILGLKSVLCLSLDT